MEETKEVLHNKENDDRRSTGPPNRNPIRRNAGSELKRSPSANRKPSLLKSNQAPQTARVQPLAQYYEQNKRDPSNGRGLHQVSTPTKKDAAKNDKPQLEYASTLSPSSCGKVLVTKWVDYTSKYGIGAKLSNGCYAVLYNDSTKMVLHKNSFNFVYIKREISQNKEVFDSLVSHYTFSEYPEELRKKVILLQHFKSYLDNLKFEPPTSAATPSERYWDVYLKKWKRANKAILFRLSNKIIQVIFQDQSELILSSGSGNVIFITSKKEVKKMPLQQDLEKECPSLFKRLNYAKEILVNMINSKQPVDRNSENRKPEDLVTSRSLAKNFTKMAYSHSSKKPDQKRKSFRERESINSANGGHFHPSSTKRMATHTSASLRPTSHASTTGFQQKYLRHQRSSSRGSNCSNQFSSRRTVQVQPHEYNTSRQ